nr:MAG TPA: hypothetical protein [Bacteriophage sp.]
MFAAHEKSRGPCPPIRCCSGFPAGGAITMQT